MVKPAVLVHFSSRLESSRRECRSWTWRSWREDWLGPAQARVSGGLVTNCTSGALGTAAIGTVPLGTKGSSLTPE